MGTYRDRRPVLLMSLALAIGLTVSCKQTRQPARVATLTFSIESIAGFGFPPSPRTSPRLERGGGTLAAPTGVVEGPDSAVYVLDLDYKKVAVFNRNGSLRLTFGEYGTEPGRFILPTALDLTDSTLLIYDFEQARVSLFDLRGRFLRAVSVNARARNIVALGQNVWMSKIASRDKLILESALSSGERLAAEIPVTPADLLFSPTGLAASLGRTPEGDLLIANLRPSIWYVMHNGQFIEHGQAAVLGKRAVVIGRRAIVPAQALGIGSFAGGRVGVLYETANLDTTGTLSQTAALDVFESSGTYLGTVQVPLPTKNAFATARDGQSFFVAYSHPYPHITMYRLSERSIGAK